MTCSATAGASPRVSSSTSSRCGRATIAIVSVRSCCSPPERLPAGSRNRASSAGKRSSASRMSSSAARRSRTSQRARRRWSATVRDGNTPSPPGAWPTPRAAMRSGARRVVSRPSMVIVPCRVRTRPETARRTVDLPDPLVPSTATISPASASRSTPNSTCTPSYSTSSPRTVRARAAPGAPSRRTGRGVVAVGGGVAQVLMPRRRAMRRSSGVAQVGECGAEPAREQEEHDEQAGAGHEDLPVDGKRPRDAAHVERAEERARDRPEAADDDHREHDETLRRRVRVELEPVLVVHEERPRERGEEAGDRERDEGAATRVDAVGARRRLVLARCHEHAAGARTTDPAYGDRRQAEGHETEEVVARLGADIDEPEQLPPLDRAPGATSRTAHLRRRTAGSAATRSS